MRLSMTLSELNCSKHASYFVNPNKCFDKCHYVKHMTTSPMMDRGRHWLGGRIRLWSLLKWRSSLPWGLIRITGGARLGPRDPWGAKISSRIWLTQPTSSKLTLEKSQFKFNNIRISDVIWKMKLMVIICLYNWKIHYIYKWGAEDGDEDSPLSLSLCVRV